MTRVIACVCARMNSERLPGKALVDVAGKPAILWPLERARKSGFETWLVTPMGVDNDPLAETAHAEGFPVSRSPRHSAREMLHAAHTAGAKHVVRITGDDLLVDPDLILRAVCLHLAHDSDYTTMPAVSRGWDSEVLSRRALELASALEETELLGFVLARLPIKRFVTALSTPHRPPLELNTPGDLERVREYLSAHAEEICA